MYDKNQSHAGYNEKGRWWHRKETDESEPDELIMQRVSSGRFRAKEISPKRTEDVQVGGVFMFEKDTITIKSPDDLDGIASEDLVEFRGEKWRVVSVQRSKAKNQRTFFGKDFRCSHYWYLELRK